MSDKKVVIALGFFDSVHIGHRSVIKKALKVAQDQNARAVVFTFSKDLRAFFGNSQGTVYTSKERKKILLSLGVDEVYFAPVTENFLSKSKLQFLDFINKKYDISAYVCGSDYTFGQNRGDVEFLKEYAGNKGQKVFVENLIELDGKKVSSTLICNLLYNGKIEKANDLLVDDYCVSGQVYEDRKIGKSIGFPTVNVKIDNEKFRLKCAVYGGYVYVGKKKYPAVINYGARPTFGLNNTLIEAHLVGFNGDLYGKNIKIYFDKFLREIKKFDTVEGLIEALKSDVERVTND